MRNKLQVSKHPMATGGAPEESAAFAACSSKSQARPTDGERFALSASELFASGWYGDAVDLFSVAIGVEPNNPSHYEGRSKCYSALGELEQAHDDAAMAVGLAPFLASCHLRLGKTQLALGMYGEARYSLQMAIMIDPALPRAREELQALMDRCGTDAAFGREPAEGAVARDDLEDRHVEGAVGGETGPEATPLLPLLFESKDWKRAHSGGNT